MPDARTVNGEAAPTDEAPPASPYVGLSFYRAEDAEFFFGRGSERQVVMSNLRAARLTLLHADSGVGKSSLLRAGVAARLDQIARSKFSLGDAIDVPVVFSSWKDDPINELIDETERTVNSYLPAGEAVALSRNSLIEAITGAVNALDVAAGANRGVISSTQPADLDEDDRPASTLLIMLDQFEEHFLYGSTDVRERLADELSAAINQRGLSANFLISIREEAFAALGNLLRGRMSNVYGNDLHLDYLDSKSAREAVELPVERFNHLHPDHWVEIEDGLVDALLLEVRREQNGDRQAGDGLVRPDLEPPEADGAATADFDGHNGDVITPYLQLVMTKLWEHDRQSGLLQLRTLEELHGASQIVGDHLAEALSRLQPEQRDIAIEALHHLVTPSGTKIALAVSDLAAYTRWPLERVAPVLEVLAGDARILRKMPPAPGKSPDDPANQRYEIYHDVLARPINQAVNARAIEHERRRAARFRRIAAGALALALVAVAGIVLTLVVWRSEVRQKEIAQQQENKAAYLGLTSQAQALLATRPDVSLLLALQAYRARPTGAPSILAKSSLLAALESVDSSGVTGILHGHTDAVTSVAFNPATKSLASASGDGTIRLWDIKSRRQTSVFDRSKQGVSTMAFSPDGRVFAAAVETGLIKVWIGSSRRAIRLPNPDRSAVTAIAFSRDSRKMAASDFNGIIRIWRLNRGTLAPPIKLSRNDGSAVRSIAFGFDRQTLAAGEGDNAGTVTLWNLSNRQPEKQWRCGGPVYGLAFGPDGRIWAGGLTGKVCLINFAGAHPRVIGASGPAIRGVAISPHGQLAAFARDDDRIAIWDAVHGRQLRLLVGHTGIVTSVAFSPDGKTLASGSTDRTIRLWNPRSDPLFGAVVPSGQGWIPLRSVDTVAMSKDGHTLVAASSQRGLNGIDVWSLTSQGKFKPVTQISGLDSGVREVAISHDGKFMVSAMENGSVQLRMLRPRTGQPRVLQQRQGWHQPAFAEFSPTSDTVAFSGKGGRLSLWDATGVRRLGANTGAVYSLGFNGDGSELAVGGDNPTITLWSVKRMRKLGTLTGHTDSVFSVAFTPRGNTLASGSGDDTVRLWNASNRTRDHVPLTGHTAYVRTVAFSPDGRTLASGSKDDSIRVWDVAHGSELGQPLRVNHKSIESVAFSPHGNFLVSGGSDGKVRIWPGILVRSSFGSLQSQVCNLVGDGLQRPEELRYAPGLPQTDPCR